MPPGNIKVPTASKSKSSAPVGRHVGPGPAGKYTYYGANGKPVLAQAPRPQTRAPAPGPGTHPVTTTTMPPPVTPFLTPAQQTALNAAITNAHYTVAADQARESQATQTTNQNLAAAQLTHDRNTDTTNSALAARGLFQSSIRAGDLNDLDTTLAMRQSVLNTSLASLITNTTAAINKVSADLGTTQAIYNSYAVANAAGVTPNTTPITTTTQVPNAPTAHPPGATPPTTVQPPSMGAVPVPHPPPAAPGMFGHPNTPGSGSGTLKLPKQPSANKVGNNNRGIPGSNKSGGALGGSSAGSGGGSLGIPTSGTSRGGG